MKHLLIAALASLSFAQAAEPLRVFIRSGEKTHEPGAHDYPAFLRDWTRLLNERGAKAGGGDHFPSAEELAATDVLILHAEEAGNITGQDRENLEAYLKRGGGVVAIHGGSVSRDAAWYKSVTGGSWNFAHTKWREGPTSIYFTREDSPITQGVSNFDIEDEIYYDMDILPEAKILATAFTPKSKDGSDDGKRPINIYDIQPQIWTYVTGNRRAFVCIPGHVYQNFSHLSLQTILLRGIAWTGKQADVDVLLKNPQQLEKELRYPAGGPTRPELAAQRLEVHPEFNLSLVASEPLINKAINIDWDEQGRLWVVESPEYPNGRRVMNTAQWKDSGSLKPGQYEREATDRISVLTDANGDGVLDHKHVFADKLELATSFVFFKNGVIAAAAPDIWLLEDTDGNQVADKRTRLYTGLGTGDTHAVINNLRWGLDGWIYATHGYSAGTVTALGAPDKPAVGIGSGVVRFKPDGTEIEMYSSRGGNTWGLCMTSDGQCFWTQPTSGTVLFHTVLPEFVLAEGKIPGTNSWQGMISGQKTFPLVKWSQLPHVQVDWVGSYTAAAGCAIYEGGAWPAGWDYSYFVGEPTLNIVSHYFVKPHGITYEAAREKGREATEFVRSKDLWFRPIETRIGPDGALYVIDFYNQAIYHNDTRGPLHGPANAAVRPDRDHFFGRIWRLQHKDAKKIAVPKLEKGNVPQLTAALKDPIAHTRMTAFRLLRESGNAVSAPTGTSALAAYDRFKNAATSEEYRALISAFSAADDNWTKSALIAAASGHALDVVGECLTSTHPEMLADLVRNLLPTVMRKNPSAAAARLLTATGNAPAAATALKTAVLEAITSAPDARIEFSAPLAEALSRLLADPATATKALPLAARFDGKPEMQALVQKQVSALAELVENPKGDAAARSAAVHSLAVLGRDDSLAPLLGVLKNPAEPQPLRLAVIAALGANDRGQQLVAVFGTLDTAVRSAAFDECLKRPAYALALLGAVESGKLDAASISPGDIARLRSHPDKAVSNRANALIDKLMPGAKEKAALIARLRPEVTKPGDAAKGKLIFAAACAICHQFGGTGTAVGPNLTGMGSHGAAELLGHVVDPNREVDPSFWQWNITKKNGETHAGIIVSENAADLTLRSQTGDVEIHKADIASRENTRRSLMPEGLEGLGADALRDILSYIAATDDSRYRIVDLRGAYTADARRGLFASAEVTADSVFPRNYGNREVEGVPFFLMAPDMSADGRNLVVLKGGGKSNAANAYPQKVEIETRIKASRLYLISGIAGWGYPAIPDNRPALKVTLTHDGGQEESTVLRNREAFADYNREIPVPGSKLIKNFVHRGQLRLITVPAAKEGEITKISLESFDNGLSPVVVAITADLSKQPAEIETSQKNPAPAAAAANLTDEPAGSTAATGQKFAEPRKEGSLRVLLVGAGSSHHFPRDFIATDRKILSQIPKADVIGTMNLEEALQHMPHADVLVFSGNHDQFGTPEFQQALHAFADAGKGMLLLHAATWKHPWQGYNARFVTGDTTGHGRGTVHAQRLPQAEHPVLNGVPPQFDIQDESYHTTLRQGAASTVLIENLPDGQNPDKHPALWIVKDPKTRIVCYTHGHDDQAHANSAYQKIIANAVQWLGAK
ncbi:MAG: ThuA domain-containing protein [Verrucomicrobiales bacterium]|nr:ThuA domain-containing protein [Verrucomicrobiales bacterium]